MSTLAVAKKDFLDVRRTKTVWLVAVAYTAVVSLALIAGVRAQSQPDVRESLLTTAEIGALVVPLLALVVTYLAIVEERESARIKSLLAVPNSRREVYVGTYLTRAVVLTAAVCLAFAIGSVVAFALYPEIHVSVIAGLTVLTVLYALVYAGVVIGLSAISASRSRALAGAIGFYVATSLLPFIPGVSTHDAFAYFFNDMAGMGVSGNAIELVRVLTSPTLAYLYATALVFPEAVIVTSTELPWYLAGEIMILVLVAWLVVPVLLGLMYFDRTDLD